MPSTGTSNEQRKRDQLRGVSARNQIWKWQRERVYAAAVDMRIEMEEHVCDGCDSQAAIICKTCMFKWYCRDCDARVHDTHCHERSIVNAFGVLCDIRHGLLYPVYEDGSSTLSGRLNYLNIRPPSWYTDCARKEHHVKKYFQCGATFFSMKGAGPVAVPIFKCNTCAQEHYTDVDDIIKSGYWPGNPIEKNWNKARTGFMYVYDTEVFRFLTALRNENPGQAALSFRIAVMQAANMISADFSKVVDNHNFHAAFMEYALVQARMEHEMHNIKSCPVCVKECNGMCVDGCRAVYRYF